MKICETDHFRCFNYPELCCSQALFKVLSLYCYSNPNEQQKVKEDLIQFIRAGSKFLDPLFHEFGFDGYLHYIDLIRNSD